jgi:putative ABC transport system permease protein
MLKNYFRSAWRNLRKNKTFTLLNLGGLSISFAACLIIYCWASDELNYDRAGINADRVYRVALTLKAKGQADKQFAETAGPLAPVLIKDFPEIENAVRFEPYNALIGYKSEKFFTNKFLFADSTFFDVFGFPMVEGNPHSALNGINNVVITEHIARKYFGKEDALGKMITCNDTILLRVAGIAKDIPGASHFNFDIICPLPLLQKAGIDDLTSWWNDDYYTYILLRNPKASVSLGSKITNIMDKYNAKQNKEIGLAGLHFLQPLNSIHLRSHFIDEINPNGSINALRILIGIAVFLLIVACINYINLTTASSFRRAKEIGIRMVSGAEIKQLIAQFLSESILITTAALAIAISLLVFLIPVFNEVVGTQISFSAHFSFGFILLLTSFAIALGILAGIYPAIYLSSVRPVIVFKSIFEKKGDLLSLRKALVVFQFTLSLLLIVATFVAMQQLDYMQTQDLGFNKDHLIAIPLHNQVESSQQDLLKTAFEANPGIIIASASLATPGKALNNNVILPEGVSQEHVQTMNTLAVDYDFIETYKLHMVAGRAFSKNYGSDSSGFILNETAIRELGWMDPQKAIGKGFACFGRKGKVIGVVKDFHFNSLQQKVSAIVLNIQQVNSAWYNYLTVRVNTKNIHQTIQTIQSVWNKVLPGHPFDYFFVDDDYNKQYQTEQLLGSLAVMFSGLTIFISCMGLFGLAMIAVSQRTKEIGVRKVLGASVTSITALLSKDFLKLVAISILIALPLSWWLMNKWLMDFAYHMSLHWWIFVIAALLVVFIALATLSFQTIKAAVVNPVKSLRTE